MDREDVRHFDVQRRLCFSVKIIKLINIEVSLCVLHRDHYWRKLDFLYQGGEVGKQKLTVTPDAAETQD